MLSEIGSFLYKLFFTAPKRLVPPAVTDDMKSRGLTWAFIDGNWAQVCDFCGGNCGQCGLTGRIGNVAPNMQRMVDKLYEKH